jgi:hypothetical protein
MWQPARQEQVPIDPAERPLAQVIEPRLAQQGERVLCRVHHDFVVTDAQSEPVALKVFRGDDVRFAHTCNAMNDQRGMNTGL